MTKELALQLNRGFLWKSITRHFSSGPSLTSNDPGGQMGRGNRRNGKLNLDEIDISEVDAARSFLLPQLVLTGDVYDIREKQFCNFHLDHRNQVYPAEIFGRVLSRYPRNGSIEIVDTFVLLFPKVDEGLFKVTIQGTVIQLEPPPESWRVKVLFFGSPSILEGDIEVFHERGLEPICIGDYEFIQNLPYLPEEDLTRLPWIFVITEEWLSGLAPIQYNPILPTLLWLISQLGCVVINYHPHSQIILNRIHHLTPGRSNYFYLDAYTITDVINLADKEFDRILKRSFDPL